MIILLKTSIEVREIWYAGVWEHYTDAGTAILENISALIGCSSYYLFLFYRWSDKFHLTPDEEDALLSLPSMAGWVNLLWFLVCYRHSGIFVIMLLKMISQDVSTFLLISGCFLGAFASSFFLLTPVSQRDFVQQTVESTAVMFGDFNLVDFLDVEKKTFPKMAVSILYFYLYFYLYLYLYLYTVGILCHVGCFISSLVH